MSLEEKTRKAENKIIHFEEKWGLQHLYLACHAAFPLALTPELLYCLRENFVPQCPWIAVADILLSSWCDTVGEQLYEMEPEIRHLLLLRLLNNPDFGKECLLEIAEFMEAYLNIKKPQSPKIERDLGREPRWVALAYISPNYARELRAELSKIKDKKLLIERLVAFENNQEDLLLLAGLMPVILDLEEDLKLEESGFLTSLLEVKVATLEEIRLDLRLLKFETLFVNSSGQTTREEQCEAYYYQEPLTFTNNGQSSKKTSQTVEPLTMIYVPEGQFWMGSPGEKDDYQSEKPQHLVKIAPFFMSQTPITQAQWRAVATLPQEAIELDINPSNFKGDNLPVESVRWQDAIEFCARLSRETGRNYRLPSEAEWEYACRAIKEPEETDIKQAGEKKIYPPFHFGETITDKLVNYRASEIYHKEQAGEYRERTTPVKSFPPNAFGLYDMHGNVLEWCLDPRHENYEGAPEYGRMWDEKNDELYQNILKNISELIDDTRSHVLRGGAWNDYPWFCRSAYRGNLDDTYFNWDVGFRVVCCFSHKIDNT